MGRDLGDAVSVTCPACGSDDTHELGRVEANWFGPGNPDGDVIVHYCSDCGNEWDTPRP
jgi:uncharacterized Zn finger protein